jgi:GNAT superfamily N-acetyltransferase
MTIKAMSLIRRGALSDAGLLAELGARTFSETFAAENTSADMAAYLEASFSPEQQSRELSDPLATFLIAEIEARAAGYAMLRPSPAPIEISQENPIELVRLYVSREWHGRGVGAALMQACIDEALRRDHGTLWLGVWEHNERAQAFYRSWNFVVVGDHIFQLGADAQRDLLMERKV